MSPLGHRKMRAPLSRLLISYRFLRNMGFRICWTSRDLSGLTLPMEACLFGWDYCWLVGIQSVFTGVSLPLILSDFQKWITDTGCLTWKLCSLRWVLDGWNTWKSGSDDYLSKAIKGWICPEVCWGFRFSNLDFHPPIHLLRRNNIYYIPWWWIPSKLQFLREGKWRKQYRT